MVDLGKVVTNKTGKDASFGKFIAISIIIVVTLVIVGEMVRSILKSDKGGSEMAVPTDKDAPRTYPSRVLTINPGDDASKWSGPIVSFDLPRGNRVEIRLRTKMSSEEFAILKKVYELSELAFIEESDDNIDSK